jgi:flagellar biosynthesis/type III secretory pathway protein FliH
MKREEWKRQQKKAAKAEQAAKHIPTNYEKGYSKGLEAGKRQAVFELSGRCTRLYTSAAVSILIDEFDFSTEQLTTFLDMIQATFEDIAEDGEREKKLREWIQNKRGITLDDHTGCRRLDVMEEVKI